MAKSEFEILQQIQEVYDGVRTRSLDISFNELADMYKNKELIIDPAYQRNFRWSKEQQSRFIESLILDLPVPAIYVIETKDGIYELIDGLQRVSSYLHYRGMLNMIKTTENIAPASTDYDDDESDSDLSGTVEEGQFLVLAGCDIIPDINGCTEANLPLTTRIRLKRRTIRLEVVQNESDPSIKYHLFKRLNTGGEKLSDQEVRNCTIRLIDSKFINFIAELATNRDFQDCTALSRSKKLRKIDEELVLRYFAFKNDREHYQHNIAEFITKYMEKVALDEVEFSYDAEKDVFARTFSVLKRIFAQEPKMAFKIGTTFSVNTYEALTISTSEYSFVLNQFSNDQLTFIFEKIQELKTSEEFRSVVVGGGLNTLLNSEKRINLVEKKLKESIECMTKQNIKQ